MAKTKRIVKPTICPDCPKYSKCFQAWYKLAPKWSNGGKVDPGRPSDDLLSCRYCKSLKTLWHSGGKPTSGYPIEPYGYIRTFQSKTTANMGAGRVRARAQARVWVTRKRSARYVSIWASQRLCSGSVRPSPAKESDNHLLKDGKPLKRLLIFDLTHPGLEMNVPWNDSDIFLHTGRRRFFNLITCREERRGLFFDGDYHCYGSISF